jgi:phasin family protein
MKPMMTPEQFVAANKANVETVMTLINSAVARAERLTALNLNTVRTVLENGTASAKALMAIKNPQDLASLQAELAQPIVEEAVAYARSVNEIVTEGQQEVAKLFEAQVAELNKALAEALDQAAKSAPAGSEAAFAALKTAMETASTAYENVSQTVKKMAETAEDNLSADAEATVKAVTGKKSK